MKNLFHEIIKLFVLISALGIMAILFGGDVPDPKTDTLLFLLYAMCSMILFFLILFAMYNFNDRLIIPHINKIKTKKVNKRLERIIAHNFSCPVCKSSSKFEVDPLKTNQKIAIVCEFCDSPIELIIKTNNNLITSFSALSTEALELEKHLKHVRKFKNSR
jgi:transcription elongation factor Elf1